MNRKAPTVSVVGDLMMGIVKIDFDPVGKPFGPASCPVVPGRCEWEVMIMILHIHRTLDRMHKHFWQGHENGLHMLVRAVESDTHCNDGVDARLVACPCKSWRAERKSNKIKTGKRVG